jgi:hypothetical protein
MKEEATETSQEAMFKQAVTKFATGKNLLKNTEVNAVLQELGNVHELKLENEKLKEELKKQQSNEEELKVNMTDTIVKFFQAFDPGYSADANGKIHEAIKNTDQGLCARIAVAASSAMAKLNQQQLTDLNAPSTKSDGMDEEHNSTTMRLLKNLLDEDTPSTIVSASSTANRFRAKRTNDLRQQHMLEQAASTSAGWTAKNQYQSSSSSSSSSSSIFPAATQALMERFSDPHADMNFSLGMTMSQEEQDRQNRMKRSTLTTASTAPQSTARASSSTPSSRVPS